MFAAAVLSAARALFPKLNAVKPKFLVGDLPRLPTLVMRRGRVGDLPRLLHRCSRRGSL